MYHITGIDYMDSTSAKKTHDHGKEDDLDEEYDRSKQHGNDALNVTVHAKTSLVRTKIENFLSPAYSYTH